MAQQPGGMIYQSAAGEWFFVTDDGRKFGPYLDQDAAKYCADNYAAFVLNAPDCHHVR